MSNNGVVTDLDTFRGLGLAYEAGRLGGTGPAWLNAANEVAVEAFLGGQLSFPGIVSLIEEALDGVRDAAAPRTLSDVQLTFCKSLLTSRSAHLSSVTQVPRRSLCGMQAPCGHSLAVSDHSIVWMWSERATLRTPWGVDRHHERRCRQ